MTLRRVSAQYDIPVSAMEIIGCVRIGTDEERQLVESFLHEACGGIEQVAQRAITYAEYELTLASFPRGVDVNVGPNPFTSNQPDGAPGTLSSSYHSHSQFGHLWPPAIELHIVPVQRVVSIHYYDPNGTLVEWDSANWQLRQDEPSVVFPVPGQTWPQTQARRDAIVIRFWAGETDRVFFDSTNMGGQFSSSSEYPWQDGDRFVLRASGLANSALGDVATVPAGFTDGRAYYVRDYDDVNKTFNLSATAAGAAIAGKCVTTPSRQIDFLYAGKMLGVTAHAVRKETLESFTDRGCSDCQCAAGKAGAEDYFFEMPHLRKLIWRSPFTY